MLSTLRTVAEHLIESALSIVGIRVGTEEPEHTSERLGDDVELRRYGPRIAAETTVAGDEEAARSEGFRRLAGFIFGKNHEADAIAMTAPVAQSAERTDVGDGWVIRFFMPSAYRMDTLPTPDDDRVRLTAVPSETYAVLRFTGDRGAGAVAARTDLLLKTLRANGFEPTDEPVAWFYDPPWTLPFRRRNEVAVPVRV